VPIGRSQSLASRIDMFELNSVAGLRRAMANTPIEKARAFSPLDHP
jgi:hypothetical protein